jgi:hypothetical protein
MRRASVPPHAAPIFLEVALHLLDRRGCPSYSGGEITVLGISLIEAGCRRYWKAMRIELAAAERIAPADVQDLRVSQPFEETRQPLLHAVSISSPLSRATFQETSHSHIRR